MNNEQREWTDAKRELMKRLMKDLGHARAQRLYHAAKTISTWVTTVLNTIPPAKGVKQRKSQRTGVGVGVGRGQP